MLQLLPVLLLLLPALVPGQLVYPGQDPAQAIAARLQRLKQLVADQEGGLGPAQLAVALVQDAEVTFYFLNED